MRRPQTGFTLVELLVAMAIMGVLFVLITNWQVSTLQVSTRTNALARSLGDMNDLTGYVGDRLRAAARVRVATSGLSVNGQNCTEAYPCLAAVLPEYTDTGVVSAFNLYVYRLGARTLITNEKEKVADTWADGNVNVLFEYRSKSSGSVPANCTLGAGETFETAAGCATLRNLNGLVEAKDFNRYVVSDYLSPASELGAGVAPFTYAPATGEITLNVQVKQQVRGQVVRLPQTQAFTMTVQARNAP